MIDTHIHFCDISRMNDLISYCNRGAITNACLVSLPDEKLGNFNAAVETAVKAYPDRFIGFGCLDYRKADVEDEYSLASQIPDLQHCGFKGLKLWIGKPLAEKRFGFSLHAKHVYRVIEAAEKASLTVLVHIADPPDFWDPGNIYADYTKSFTDYLDTLEALLHQFPEVQWIIAHAMFLGKGYSYLERLLTQFPRLYLDLAPGRWFYQPMALEREQTTAFFSRFRHRILLGSDAMFFPDSYIPFGNVTVEESLGNLLRLKQFLSTCEIVDDPYPAHAKQTPEHVGLGLDQKITDRIFHVNAREMGLFANSL